MRKIKKWQAGAHLVVALVVIPSGVTAVNSSWSAVKFGIRA